MYVIAGYIFYLAVSSCTPTILGFGSVLRIHQSGSEAWCISDEGVFWKQSLHKLLIFRLLNLKA